MTFTYNSVVSEVRIGGFLKLLLVWKASVYKLIYSVSETFISTHTCIFI